MKSEESLTLHESQGNILPRLWRCGSEGLCSVTSVQRLLPVYGQTSRRHNPRSLPRHGRLQTFELQVDDMETTGCGKPQETEAGMKRPWKVLTKVVLSRMMSRERVRFTARPSTLPNKKRDARMRLKNEEV